jgi:hypothetical protein
MPDPFWERAPKGKLHRPEGPEQEVLANGMQCGDRITQIMQMWHEAAGLPMYGQDAQDFMQRLKYPKDLPAGTGDVRTPFTEATMFAQAEDVPILAWSVAPSGNSVAVVVDMTERGQSNYPECKVIQGTANELLPQVIQEQYKIGFNP